MDYQISDARYANAEKKFLQEFEKEWQMVLFDLKCQQSQLLIGHRLRPRIAFWGYVCGKKTMDLDMLSYRDIAHIAVSIELLHKASLLLDDWLDNDLARHGEKAFHVEYGEHYTVVFALHLVGLATQRIQKVITEHFNNMDIYDACIMKVIDTIYSMSLGALQELQLEHYELYNNTKVKAIAQLETAKIIENSLQIGYLFSQANNESVIAILQMIGSQCGYLFQTLNDLEAFSNALKNMEHKGNTNFDIDNDRKNIVISMLWELASSKDQKKILHSSGNDILQLSEKYHLRSFVIKDMEIVYDNMLNIIHGLSDYGVCQEWIDAFTSFLKYIRAFAYQRL